MQDGEADGDAPPGKVAAEEPAAVGTAPVATEPQKKLPKALLARLKQRGVLKEGASTGAGTAVNGSIATPVATAGGASTSAAAGLPPGWQTAVDPTYNHPYWFNVCTGERRWTPPEGATTVSTGGPAAAGSVVATGGLGSVAQPSAAAADVPLPAGWKAAVDMATGITYYYSVRLNMQQWERPTGAAVAGAANVSTGGAASVGEDEGTFVASKSFSGVKAGYVFTKGEQGLGYYRCVCLYALFDVSNVD